MKRWDMDGRGGMMPSALGRWVEQVDLAAEVSRLTAERDEAREQNRKTSWMGEGYALVEARAEAAEAALATVTAERDRLSDLFDNGCYFSTPEDRAKYGARRVVEAETRAEAAEAALATAPREGGDEGFERMSAGELIRMGREVTREPDEGGEA